MASLWSYIYVLTLITDYCYILSHKFIYVLSNALNVDTALYYYRLPFFKLAMVPMFLIYILYIYYSLYYDYMNRHGFRESNWFRLDKIIFVYTK